MNCDICKKELAKNKCCSAYGLCLCAKHYQQIIKFGHTLDTNPKTTHDLNDIEYCDDGIWVITYDRRCNESGRFLIDNDEYAAEILKHKWRFWRGRYYTGNKNIVAIYIMVLTLTGVKLDPDAVVDHKNNNPADNRKANLRPCLQSKNTLNKSKQINNSSDFIGIHFNEKRKMWETEIMYQGKRVHFTRQKLLENAIYIRYIAEILLFKEFRCNKYDDKIKPYLNNCKCKLELQKYVKNKLSQFYTLD